ncbi:MAG: transporter [Eubacteriales bacterium]|nr:transporter [Eubacteriales bacterium]
MKKFSIKDKIQQGVYSTARYLEMLLSVMLAVVIVIMAVKLAAQMFNVNYFWNEAEAFTHFLEMVMSLAVGVELIKMLCIHTPETVVEVLLFAIARQIVVSHSSIIDTMIGVVCIAVLFATRRFLFMATDDKETD